MPTSMGDEDSGMPTLGSVTKKKINELRVVDLRTELERRGLDKNGIKAILIERLSEVGFCSHIFKWQISPLTC